MTYAVLLSVPEALQTAPVAEALAAFKGVPLQDAAHAAKNCWGIVAEGLTEAEAKTLASRLDSAGAGGLAVPAGLLEDAPAPRPAAGGRIERARLEGSRCTEPALWLSVEGDREEKVPLERVCVIAAAGFTEETAPPAPKTPDQPKTAERLFNLGIMLATGLPLGIGKKKEPAGPAARPRADVVFYLDVCLRKPAARWRVDAQSFDYSCLGARMSYGSFANFKMLLTELAAMAPTACQNRGAKFLIDGKSIGQMGYLGMADFERECRWLLTLDGLKNP